MSGPPTSADERSCVDVEARHGFAGARPRVGGCGGPCRGPPRRTMSERLRVQQGGDGGPVLLLLHGLGATGDVWRGLLDLLNDRWPGRWVAPDLPGHGGSEALASYSFGRLAAAVAPAVPPADRVVALGHSPVAVGAPDMTGLIAAWRAPVVLAAGERDPMSTARELRALVPDPVILPVLGHNAHVEDPAALWPLLQRLAS